MSALIGAGVRAGSRWWVGVPRPLILAGVGLVLAAVALVAPLAVVGLIGLAVVVVGGLWLEAGFVLYLVSQHFVLYAKRMFVSGPLGLALDGVLCLMLFGLFLRLTRPGGQERRRWQHTLVGAVLLLKCYQMVDAFNPASLNLLYSVYGMRQLIPNLAIFMLTVFLIYSRQRLWGLLAGWFSLLAIVGGYAINQQFNGFTPQEWAWMNSPDGTVWLTAQGVLRMYSTLSPDTLGISMVYAILLALSLLLAPIRPGFKLLLVALIPVCGLALLYSGTRSAYAALLVGAALVVLLSGRWYLYLGVPLLTALTVVGVDWTANYWGRRFLSAFSPERDSSFQIRQQIIGQHLNDSLNSPFGNGTATTSYAGFAQEQIKAAKAAGVALANGVDVPTDNNYFLVLIENGVVGEILFLVMLAGFVWFALRLALTLRDQRLRCLAVGLTACTVAAMAGSFSNNYLEFWGTWLILGLICTLDQMARVDARAATATLSRPAATRPAAGPQPAKAVGR